MLTVGVTKNFAEWEVSLQFQPIQVCFVIVVLLAWVITHW